MFLTLVFFSSIFFKIWWNVLFGSPSKLGKINDVFYINIKLLLLWLLLFQFLIGVFPSILTSSIGYIL